MTANDELSANTPRRAQGTTTIKIEHMYTNDNSDGNDTAGMIRATTRNASCSRGERRRLRLAGVSSKDDMDRSDMSDTTAMATSGSTRRTTLSQLISSLENPSCSQIFCGNFD